ncbi:unnamed protein product [Ceutorhynchus assimilis]|uniref:Fatty acid synthase n=1 Tax=Ceutorhynchus assimilis TaxID=467358 RepID=A0A9P0DIX2_9CUCU|nr:unnamed protein product [Ceutorhynchus assimilis]
MTGHGVLSCAKAMLPNRISYIFDFKGPSYAMDTACSSSLTALENAVNRIKSGEIDAAIVGGSNLLLKPALSLEFHKLGMLSPQGKCNAFDATGDGYVRSEAVAVVFLQKANVARRVYATILAAKINTDGYKEEGITFPSGTVQNQLIKDTFAQINVHPNDVFYVEAHGTGTKAGDPQEAQSLANFFCQDRPTPLLIGSVKSNMGHAEAASGIAALIKILIAMDSGVIPGNLHFETPIENILALSNGRMKVLTENTSWNGGIMAMNSFGFGGANAHVVLQSNPKQKILPLNSTLLRVVGVSGRTESAVKYFLKQVHQHRHDQEFLALVDEINSKNINGHYFRGYSLLNQEPIVEVSQIGADKRPICFIYSGMGSQWPEMAKDLIKIPVFKATLEKCAKVMEPYGIDLMDMVVNGGAETFDDILNSFVGIMAMQIALTEILRTVGIEPDIIIGHSAGETTCAYADRTLTIEQSMLAAYYRGRTVLDSDLQPGLMAAVGLTWEEAKSKCPPEIYPACHNGKDSVTISGPKEAMIKFITQLQSENIFAKEVNTGGFAFHCKHIAGAGPRLQRVLDAVIPNPKPRSQRWISSSFPESSWNTPLAQYSSSAYQVNNLLSPVLFQETLAHIPENAIAIEIAPTGLLQAILRRSLAPSVVNIPLMKKFHHDNVEFFLMALGKIYNAGAQPQLKKLYDPVSFPVSNGTPMLNSLIEWDHSVEWTVPNLATLESNQGSIKIDINLDKEADQYLMGHTIGGRILYPAAGYLMLVWKCLAKLNNIDYEKMPIQLKNVQFHRATVLSKENSVKLSINIFEGTGQFEICEGDSVVATGTVSVLEPGVIIKQEENNNNNDGEITLESADIYKIFRLRGYKYTNEFQGIIKSDKEFLNGKLQWQGNWVTFIDTMLQFLFLSINSTELHLPTQLDSIIIKPQEHLSIIDKRHEVDINRNQYLQTIRAGGIEIRDLQIRLASEKVQAQLPKLEKYLFVPLRNNFKEKVDALTVICQLVLENSLAVTNLKVTEYLGKKLVEAAIAPTIASIFEAEPLIYTDATIVTSTEDNTITSKTKIITKDISNNLIDNNAHVIIINNASKSLLVNAKKSIKEGGFVLVEESRQINNDTIFTSLDLEIISIQSTESKSYILLRVSQQVAQNSLVVQATENSFAWIDTLKEALKTNLKVYVYSIGEPQIGLIGMINCLIKETRNVRSICIEDKNALPFTVEAYEKQLKLDLVHNVFKNNSWGTYRHLPLLHDTHQPMKHAFITTLTRGDLSSLKWIQRPPTYHNNANQICNVHYSSLNFKDIMLATGKLTLENETLVLGLEFSGKDSNGRRIMGILSTSCLATTVQVDTDEGFIWEVPDKWSLEEAATIPIVYGTCYYALIVRGKMLPGESVLVHAGAGGVGQAAIAIALHMGCKVFTTVSTEEKRSFLKKTFPALSDDSIGSSRNTSFEQMVLTQTNGKGVDLVLNSLAGEFLQASIRCLAKGGRFLEIGKVDVANNTPLGMKIFSYGRSFHGVALDHLLNISKTEEVKRLMDEGIKSGAVQPLTRTVFNENEVEKAFRFMSTGKHIGKILIKIRDELTVGEKCVDAITSSYMDPKKSYIVVGGLGGFGLELAKWLVTRGAKNIVLVSTRGITTEYQAFCINRLRNLCVKVIISTIDASTAKGARQLLNDANELAPVGGIFNLAIVLQDALFENQTISSFEVAYKPKANISKQLDALSRTLAPTLDYFVSFSSFSCGRGNAGQTNYGLANSTIERITEARQEAGLPGLAIQWGPIGEIGILGSNDDSLQGALPQKMTSCLETLDYFLSQPHPVVASMVVADKNFIQKSAQKSLTDVVANILGIKDLSTVPFIRTLVDLGIDSLMGTEIKQTLERNFDLTLSIPEIRALTFGRLRELSEGGIHTPQKQVVMDNVEQILPSQTLIKFNTQENGNHGGKSPIFMIHPMEGTADCFKTLAEHIDAPVYGLQCTRNAPLDSISSLAQFYIIQIQNVQPKGPYNLMGYSYGTLVLIEMGLILEKQGKKSRLLFLDGSPNYMATQSRIMTSGGKLDLQNITLCVFMQRFGSKFDQKSILQQLSTHKTLTEKTLRVAMLLEESTTFDKQDIIEAARFCVQRIIIGDEYQPGEIFNGPVMLVKAKKSIVTQIDVDYGLSKICSFKPLLIEYLDGDHGNILLEQKTVEKFADILNQFFS